MTTFAASKRHFWLASLTASLALSGCTSAAAQNAKAVASAPEPAAEAAETTTLQRSYRGKMVCTAPDGTNCGTDHWSVFLHRDGTRVMNVASETARAGEVRHAMIVIEADGTTSQAFMHNRSKSEALGSSYVLQTADGVDQAIHNGSGLGAEDEGIQLSSVESDAPIEDRTIGTGPAAADGTHFLNFDAESAGGQPHNVFWMGGTFGGTMAGVFRPSTYTLLGEETIAMPQGYDIVTEHFKMASGSEIWLTKDSKIVVRADVRFGPSPALRYELKELHVTPLGE